MCVASITLMIFDVSVMCLCVCGSILSWDTFTVKKNVTGKPWKTSFIVDKSKLPSNISRKKITSPSAPTGSRNHRSSRRLRRRSSWAKSRRNDRTVMTSRPALVGKNRVCRIEIQACRKRLIKMRYVIIFKFNYEYNIMNIMTFRVSRRMCQHLFVW